MPPSCDAAPVVASFAVLISGEHHVLDSLPEALILAAMGATATGEALLLTHGPDPVALRLRRAGARRVLLPGEVA